MAFIETDDATVAGLLKQERERQARTLSLIAAESTAPESILEAMGSAFNNKTSEGYPGRRYHTGCQILDELERLAIERAKTLFGAEHANVQPHSGVSANLAVYAAMLKPGSTLLGMKLSHGGHLSHGDAASLTGRIYQAFHYSVHPETERLDYDQIRELARLHRPAILVAGASSYPRLIDYAILRGIADEVSALLLVDMAHIAGLVAARVIPSPVPHADFVTFTTYKTLLGPHGGVILCKKAFASKIDRSIFPATQGTSTPPLIAAKAVCFKLAAEPGFARIQARILQNARALAEALAGRGYRIVSGGTDNHMVLIDLRSKGLTGNIAERALEEVGLLVNRNLIPFDPESPQVTSGLRVGATGLARRGMGEPETRQVAEWMDRVLQAPSDAALKEEVGRRVLELCARFPIPETLAREETAG